MGMYIRTDLSWITLLASPHNKTCFPIFIVIPILFSLAVQAVLGVCSSGMRKSRVRLAGHNTHTVVVITMADLLGESRAADDAVLALEAHDEVGSHVVRVSRAQGSVAVAGVVSGVVTLTVTG